MAGCGWGRLVGCGAHGPTAGAHRRPDGEHRRGRAGVRRAAGGDAGGRGRLRRRRLRPVGRPGQGTPGRRELRRRRDRRDRGGGPRHGYRPTADAADLAGFDVAVDQRADPAHDGAPDLQLHRERRPRARRPPPARRAASILESTTYPGTTTELLAPILEEASGLAPGDYRLGYSPERIDPGNATHTFVNTPKVDERRRRRLAGRGRCVLRRARRHDRAGRLPRRGRAGQAAREHVPPRQHRAGQRAGDVRPRARRRRLAGDRRRVDQAVRLHAVHARARASAGTACRSTRAISRGG